MIKPDFLFNTVLSPDKQIVGAFAGDLEAAHLAACALARTVYTAPLAESAELAVVSCGGHPKDINFVQAHKALDYGVNALVPNGTIILLAACPDGFGNPTFFDWFQYSDQAFTGRGDGENYQIGFIDICDNPYPEIIGAARKIGYHLYQTRMEQK